MPKYFCTRTPVRIDKKNLPSYVPCNIPVDLKDQAKLMPDKLKYPVAQRARQEPEAGKGTHKWHGMMKL
jgi:hypothetical protein